MVQYKATALMLASGRGHHEIVEMLLLAGADAEAKDKVHHALQQNKHDLPYSQRSKHHE